MRLFSARPDSPDVSCFRARSLQYGSEEFIYPPRVLRVEPGFSDWADEDGKRALEMHGPSGVTEARLPVEERAKLATTLGHEPTPAEIDEAIVLRAKTIRHKFLHRQLMNYRLAVSAQQAAGTLTGLPGPFLTDIAAEFRGLDAWVKKNDPVLALIGGLPTETPRDTVERVINDEIQSIGGMPAPAANPATELPL